MTLSRQRTHDAKRIKEGWRRIPVWLDPETLVALAASKNGRSEQETIRAAVRQAAADEP
jgi:hypothetical protein